jgi:hypothetical protein
MICHEYFCKNESIENGCYCYNHVDSDFLSPFFILRERKVGVFENFYDNDGNPIYQIKNDDDHRPVDEDVKNIIDNFDNNNYWENIIKSVFNKFNLSHDIINNKILPFLKNTDENSKLIQKFFIRNKINNIEDFTMNFYLEWKNFLKYSDFYNFLVRKFILQISKNPKNLPNIIQDFKMRNENFENVSKLSDLRKRLLSFNVNEVKLFIRLMNLIELVNFNIENNISLHLIISRLLKYKE